MILLTQNKTNTIALTLNEKCSITGTTPYFLFNLKNVNSKFETFFTAPEYNVCNSRFNGFYVTLTGQTYQDLTGGTLNLKTGVYDYSIYSQTGQTNLDITGVTELCEVGILKVIDDVISTTPTLNNIKTNQIFYKK